jgi:hypothetical protein
VKEMSRAKRASKLADELKSAADKLREISGDDDMKDEDKIKAAQDVLEDVDLSEGSELQEEMENWRDGLADTNLANSEKFSRIEEAADTLGNIDWDVPSIDSVDEIDSAATDLDNIADELEGVDFPGMYG